MAVYVAPITLGFTPANGDLIGGTVNGVEVNGKWTSESGVILYEDRQQVCSVGIIDDQAIVGVMQESAPTTDYELHLYRYTPTDIVQIPQEYVEGLEDVTENANAAKTAAETAQTTANAAKTTAETAQSTANRIKPDWNETSTTSPKYIANRPCYYDLILSSKDWHIFTPSIPIDGTQLYKSQLKQPQNEGGALIINETKTYVVCESLEKIAPIKIMKLENNQYSYGYAIGNLHLIAYLYDNITDTHGNPFPDTGGDWVYMHTPGSSTYITIGKIKNQIVRIAELLSEELKMLDEKFIPYTIQRAGSDVIVKSSTPDSTKKFKITVDDAGVISATEVTT